jgi:hypothetical protein
MRPLLLITLLTALVPSVNAQRMVSASPHFAPHFNRGGHPRSFLYPLAFSDPFYSDYMNGYPAAPQPPVVIVQPPPAAAPITEYPSPAEPLTIELQGDRYVRISGQESSGAQMIDPTLPSVSKPRRQSAAAIHAVDTAQLPIAVLLFRDGHREETTSYTIADGVLYISANPYTGGPWIRKIELSSLNLPETVSSNQSRGIKFQLPSAPNEVLVGP